MKRLTFGVAALPYLASTTGSQRLHCSVSTSCKSHQHHILCGSLPDRSLELHKAIELQQQLFHLLQQAGMKLRKWQSNSQEVLDVIPPDLQEVKRGDLIICEPSKHGKTLGIHWDTKRDQLHISVPNLEDVPPTKRIIASAAPRLYDVLGWFSPATLFLKILLQ